MVLRLVKVEGVGEVIMVVAVGEMLIMIMEQVGHLM
jgi:hypothetical protein